MAEAGIETAYCTDNPFLIGPRFGNFRRTLDEVKPSFSQGAYRFLNKPFKRPATRSTIERYLLPELSDSVEVGRLRAMAGWNSIYRDQESQYPTARVVRSGINLVDDLKKQRPFFLGVDAFDPHEPLDAPQAFQLAAGVPKGHRDLGRNHPDPAVRDPLLVGRRRRPRRRDHGAGARALRRRDHLPRRVDRAADEQDGRREAARRDRRRLHVRPRADAGRARHHGQARRSRPVAHLPRAGDDPAPRGQARRRDERLLRLHPRRPTHAALDDGRARAGADERRGPLGDLRRRGPARAALVHLLLRRPRARRRHRLVPAGRQRGAAQAPLRPPQRPARAARRGRR